MCPLVQAGSMQAFLCFSLVLTSKNLAVYKAVHKEVPLFTILETVESQLSYSV